VTFSVGTRPINDCLPVVVVTPFADIDRHATITNRNCTSGAPSFTVKTFDTAGVLQDTPFLFLAL
jgi:hypothetical protein